MRKLVFLFGTVCVLSLVSCDKSKECECVTTYKIDGEEVLDPVTNTFTLTEGKCSDADQTVTQSGMSVEMTCAEL